MKAASYVCADKLDERFAALDQILKSDQPTLSYLYIPELDQIAHRFGVESTQWLEALEELDMVVNRFHSKLKPNIGVLITADHGVIDVPISKHVYVDELDWYRELVLHTAGDPRCNFVYLRNVEDSNTLKEKLETEFGNAAYICTPMQLELSGWIAPFNDQDRHLFPDFFIIWREAVVSYDRRTAKPNHLKLIGQHGAISDTETRVPLIRLGKY
jgi:predicted AlkP superfamily pyrophosphatase or phosphodiesterase